MWHYLNMRGFIFYGARLRLSGEHNNKNSNVQKYGENYYTYAHPSFENTFKIKIR